MSPAWGHVVGAFTVVVMAAFIGVWIWAWLPWHKRAFDALAAIPMEDGDDDAGGADDPGDAPLRAAAVRETERR